MTFKQKYRILNDIRFPVNIIGLGNVNLETHPIEVVDEWYKNGLLNNVIVRRKSSKKANTSN